MDTMGLTQQIHPFPGADLILRVADYRATTVKTVSPNFEIITNGDEASLAWFDSDPNAAMRFAPFAMSADGGLFAYWLCGAAAPIVFLASECDGSRVIARTTEEFFSLVAFGSDDYCLDIQYTDRDEEWNGLETTPDSLLAFREWLRTEFNIHPSASPLAIIRYAMETSPRLMDWIRAWQERKYGTQAQ